MTPDVNIIKLFYLSLTTGPNKFKHLSSLAIFSSQARKNGLAYLASPSITDVKSFITLTPGVDGTKLFTSEIFEIS